MFFKIKNKLVLILTLFVASLLVSASKCDSYLSGFEGKVIQKGKIKPKAEFVILEFFQTWCGHCRNSVKHLNELNRRKDVKIISASDENEDAIRIFIEKLKPRYEIRQVSEKLFRKMGVEWIPYVFIYRKSDKKILWQGHSAKIDDKLLDDLKQEN